MIPSTLSLHLRSQLTLLKSKRTSAETRSLLTLLLLLYRRRLYAGFGAVQLAAKRDLRKIPAGRIVNYTRCRRCGRTGLSLLTSSTREHPSPRLMDKLHAVLPSPAPLSPAPDRQNTPARLRLAGIRLGKLVRFRLHSAFDKLYTLPLAKSLASFEFRPSELVSPDGEKANYMSFTSEGGRNGDKSYEVAVKLLMSRLEKAFRHRVSPVYEEVIEDLFQ